MHWISKFFYPSDSWYLTAKLPGGAAIDLFLFLSTEKCPLFSTSGCSLIEKQLTWSKSKVMFSTSHTNSCEIVEGQIAGMAFFSTGSCSFLCNPRPGMLGNQCTALINALTSCLYRKLTRLLLISWRSQSVCEIVLPIKTCLSMKTSKGMWSYQVRHLLSKSEIESYCMINVV